jgi:hypothetical protein
MKLTFYNEGMNSPSFIRPLGWVFHSPSSHPAIVFSMSRFVLDVCRFVRYSFCRNNCLPSPAYPRAFLPDHLIPNHLIPDSLITCLPALIRTELFLDLHVLMCSPSGILSINVQGMPQALPCHTGDPYRQYSVRITSSKKESRRCLAWALNKD